MKSIISRTLLLASMLCLLAIQAYGQKLSVSFKDKPFVQVLAELESQIDYSFVYQKQVVEGMPNVTCTMKDASLAQILDRIFDNSGLSYEIVYQNIVIRKSEKAGQIATDQKITVKGVVTSIEESIPIPFASVVIKGTMTGTETSEQGEFTLEDVPANAILIVSSVGYTTQSFAVNGRSQLSATLHKDQELIEETVVVAYGSAKKGSITGSAAVVDNKKLEKRVSSNFSKSLEGQVAGVMVTSGSGAPGEGNSIVVRGFGSINASKTPLYVVDGIPYDGGINAINPNDIESITVLKDASSGALYGARGANGVIMITTKKGKSGKATVSYQGSVGWSNPALPYYERVSQQDFTQLTYESLRNNYWASGKSWEEAMQMAKDNLSKEMGGEKYNPFKNYTWENIIDSNGYVHSDAVSAWDEDWLDDGVVNHNSFRTEHQLTVSGGTEKTKAMMSLGYLNDNGYVHNSGFTRLSARANVESEVTSWLAAGLNLNLSKSDFKGMMNSGDSYGNQFYYAQLIGPIYPIYEKDENGKTVLDELGNKVYDYGEGRPSWPGWNIVGLLYDDDHNQQNMNEGVRTFVRLGSDSDKAGFLKGLKFTVNFGGDNRDAYETYYNNMYNGNYAAANGRLYKYFKRTTSYTLNELLAYKRTFGDHTVDFVGGHEYYRYVYHYIDATKTNLADGIRELRPATSNINNDSYSNEYAIESYLSRLNYDYANKYYLSASFRRDGSSRFYKDNRWGNFWSVGGNWRMSKENFMQKVSWVDNLNLRASYGVQGNDDLSTYYAWQSFYSLSYANDGMSGAKISTLENKNVTWEKNANFNVGLDAKLFNSRLDFTVEYYNRLTTDMLLSYPMALSTGFSGYDANVGSMVNKGVEFSVTGVLIDKKNFLWKANVMGSSIKNTILDLTTEAPSYVSGQQIYEEGRSIYTFYMVKYAGVDPETGVEQYWAYESMDEKGNPVGEYKTTDFAVATGHKYYLGGRMPKISGSIGTDFVIFKDFDLSILTTYSLGGYIYDTIYKELLAPTQYGRALATATLDRWQKPGDITDIPRAALGGSSPISSRLLIDASYFAIKNITFGYNLPKKWINCIGSTGARIYVSLDNLKTFTHLDGMNPQQSLQGTTTYSYIPTKTTVVGLKLNF